MLNCWCITWPVGFKRLIHRHLSVCTYTYLKIFQSYIIDLNCQNAFSYTSKIFTYNRQYFSDLRPHQINTSNYNKRTRFVRWHCQMALTWTYFRPWDVINRHKVSIYTYFHSFSIIFSQCMTGVNHQRPLICTYFPSLPNSRSVWQVALIVGRSRYVNVFTFYIILSVCYIWR